MNDDADGDEFALIARHFAPLAQTPEARGLIDDVALVRAPGDLVVTTDAIVEGVHFLAGDPLDLVARKALRVNVSDLAAKGARARFYLVSLVWPDARPAGEVAAFAAGLAEDQRLYDLVLLGGDTARTPGPLTISVTMFGAPLGRTPERAGAQAGDDLWVSGTIGDSDLGLAALRGALEGVDGAQQAWLASRYRLPEPRTALAPLVARAATASCDVSDGLIADCGKIAAASRAAIDIEAGAIPLSRAAAAWAGADEGRLAALAGAGDDYEILFTAPAAARAAIAAEADRLNQALTRIGRVKAGGGARLIGASGPLETGRGGHSHRLGGGAR